MGQAAQLAEVADALRTTAGVYTSTGNDLDTTTFALTGIVENLLASWQGASSTAFVNACNKAWNDEEKISGSLSSTASALTALAGVLENNATSIGTYETDAASTTIQTAALQAAGQAADLAWAAIASAVTEQAAAIEAAAAQVGVCSIGEGGPWDDNGLNLKASNPDPGQGTAGSGTTKTYSWVAKLLARLAGPGMKLLSRLLDSLPVSLQKAVATLVGGAGNALPAALTSGVLSGPTLSTFITASLGSLVGSYVVDALAVALGEGVASSATTITSLTIAGGVGMGVLTVYVLKPLVLNNIIPQQQTPEPTVVVTSVPNPGEETTTITRSDGSQEIIDSKPNGTSVIIEKNSSGKVISTKTVPTK